MLHLCVESLLYVFLCWYIVFPPPPPPPVHIRGTYKDRTFEERDMSFDFGEGEYQEREGERDREGERETEREGER